MTMAIRYKIKLAFLEHDSINGKIVVGEYFSFSRISMIKTEISSLDWFSSEFFLGPIMIFDTA